MNSYPKAYVITETKETMLSMCFTQGTLIEDQLGSMMNDFNIDSEEHKILWSMELMGRLLGRDYGYAYVVSGVEDGELLKARIVGNSPAILIVRSDQDFDDVQRFENTISLIYGYDFCESSWGSGTEDEFDEWKLSLDNDRKSQKLIHEVEEVFALEHMPSYILLYEKMKARFV